MMKRILILLAITVTAYGQQIRGIDLHSSAKDTINAVIGRSPGFTVDVNSKAVVSSSFLADSLVAADTTALKLRKGATDGAMIYLAGLSSTNRNGGGWFVYADSAYSENGVIAYDAGVNGKQWVNADYKNNNIIYAEQCGMVGDGATNNSAQLNKILAIGAQIKLESGNTYLCAGDVETSGNVDISATGHRNATIKFNGAYNFTISGSPTGNAALITSDILPNTHKFIADDLTGFSVGNLITITTDSAHSWPYDPNNYAGGARDYRWGEIHKILRLDGDSLWVEDKIWTGWNVDLGKQYLITEYSPALVNITNIDIDYSVAQNVTGLEINYASPVHISNIKIDNAKTIGLQLHYVYDCLVEKSEFRSASQSGYGYGCRVDASSIVKITECNFHEFFKGIEISTSADVNDYGRFAARNVTITNNYFDGSGWLDDGDTSELFLAGNRGVNSHSPSENVIITGNLFNNIGYAIAFAGTGLHANNNRLAGNFIYCFVISYGNNCDIMNNVYESGLVGIDTVGSTSVYDNSAQNFIVFISVDSSENSYFNVSGNKVNSIYNDFIGNGNPTELRNLTVSNNDVTFYDPDSATVYFLSGYGYRDLRMYGNTVRSLTSTIVYDAAATSGYSQRLYWDNEKYNIRGGQVAVDSMTISNGTLLYKILKVSNDLLIITDQDTFVIDSVRAK